LAVLELLWHPDAVAFAFSRDDPATGEDELDVLGETYRGRFLGTDELARFEPSEPLADSARAVLHVRELARRAVSEGLVFPQAAEIGGEWFAFWGATLEAEIEQTLTLIAAASPPSSVPPAASVAVVPLVPPVPVSLSSASPPSSDGIPATSSSRGTPRRGTFFPLERQTRRGP
jgi:hypothetical protein